MPIGPVRYRDRLRTAAPDEPRNGAGMLVARTKRPIRKTQVDAPYGVQHLPRGLGFREPLVHGAVAAHLAGCQVAQPDAMAERSVPGHRAAHPDLDVVGVRTDGEEINRFDSGACLAEA